jgi:hypothetical protein
MLTPIVARAPGWEFDASLYVVILLVGGLVILAGAVLLSVQHGRPFSSTLASARQRDSACVRSA